MSETGSHDQLDDATVDLLIKQVTEGLSPAEQRELDAREAELGGHLRDFERAAAALSLAGAAPLQALPPALSVRLQEQALRFPVSPPAAAPAAPRASPPAAVDNVLGLGAPRDAAAAPRARPAPARGLAGWYAAAACLLLAAAGWYRSAPLKVAPVADVHEPAASTVAPTVAPVEEPPQPTPAEERAALLAKADSLKVTLAATKDPGAAGVTGDAVWDPATQQGFLRFVGLRTNDPNVHQYQIWIFDGTRDKRYPVPGGIFDVPADSAEVIIPIHATLPVRMAKAFAVTIEKPGGVVVSGLAHVVVLGAAGS